MLLVAALAVYALGIVAFGVCACWAALGTPWSVLQPVEGKLRSAFVGSGWVGFAVCFTSAFVVHHGGPDTHWWPFVGVVWGSAWLVSISVLLIAIKLSAMALSAFRSRSGRRT